MKPRTKDQIEGKLHEMKGALKEKWDRSRTTPTWRLKVKPRSSAARSKRKLARLKGCSKGKRPVSRN